jgi:hypothetical protein
MLQQYQNQWMQTRTENGSRQNTKTVPKTVATNMYREWTQTEYQNSTKNSGYNTYREWTQTEYQNSRT